MSPVQAGTSAPLRRHWGDQRRVCMLHSSQGAGERISVWTYRARKKRRAPAALFRPCAGPSKPMHPDNDSPRFGTAFPIQVPITAAPDSKWIAACRECAASLQSLAPQAPLVRILPAAAFRHPRKISTARRNDLPAASLPAPRSGCPALHKRQRLAFFSETELSCRATNEDTSARALCQQYRKYSEAKAFLFLLKVLQSFGPSVSEHVQRMRRLQRASYLTFSVRFPVFNQPYRHFGR